MSKNFVLITSQKEKLRITTYGYENAGTVPCIILVHGFKGFKDWGFGPYIGKYLSENGFFVITFNFSHNGVGNSLTEFTELDKFANNTFSLEFNELNEIISAYLNGNFCNVNNKNIGLLGHSRGGAISIITGCKNNSVNAVATWASVSNLDRYSEIQKVRWREKGVFEVLNTRTNQVMKLNVSLLEDIEKNGEDNLNIKKSVKNLNKPFLIAHGKQDLAVPFEEAENIFEWADKKLTEFYPIESTGHTFNIQHPFKGSNQKFDILLNKTAEFFKSNLIRK
ncbi:MAG: alpha/beta hydrolase [Ignavibacteriales bacterium CG_4_9_14_3_um_filter_30_11]|nr:MAG: alpha/beta hydrolase [Ignavibacteriales bacterium CG_4_9_14_3_um_filter_30_11]